MTQKRKYTLHTLYISRHAFRPYIFKASKLLAPVFVKRRNRGTPNYAKAIDIMTAVIEGHSRISNMNHCFSPIQSKIYHNSATYFKMLYRLDHRDNFVPWYETYKISTVALTQEASYEFIRSYIANSSGNVNFDLSTLAVWGTNFEFAERGYGIPPKQLGYQLAAMAIEIGDLTLWTYSKLVPGYATSQLMFDTLFSFLKKLMDETNFVPKVVLLDAGFHSTEHIIKLDDHFKFIMAAPKIQRYTRLKYEQVTSTISYSEIELEGRRFRVIKKRAKNEKGEYEDHYFVTNLFDVPVKRVLELYRRRWVIENSLFNEIKNGFELHIPSSNFVVSTLYIELVRFAYNIFRLAMLRVYEAIEVRIRGVRRFRGYMQQTIAIVMVSRSWLDDT